MQKLRITNPVPFFGSGLARIKNMALVRRNRLRNATRGLAQSEREKFSGLSPLGAVSRETSIRGQEVKSKFWARHIIAKNIMASRKRLAKLRGANASEEKISQAKEELARQRQFGKTLLVNKQTTMMGLFEKPESIPMHKGELKRSFRPIRKRTTQAPTAKQ